MLHTGANVKPTYGHGACAFCRRKLRWDLDISLKRAIQYAEVAISDQIAQNEVRTLDFKGYGKRWIGEALCCNLQSSSN